MLPVGLDLRRGLAQIARPAELAFAIEFAGNLDHSSRSFAMIRIFNDEDQKS